MSNIMLLRDIHKDSYEISSILFKEAEFPKLITYPIWYMILLTTVLIHYINKKWKKIYLLINKKKL